MYQYDMGQNAAATITLRLPPTGMASDPTTTPHDNSTTIDFQLHFSEVSPDGPSLNVANMTYRTTVAKLAMDGVTFTPSFTYGGFRFVQITVSSSSAENSSENSLLPTLTEASLVSHFTHSDVQAAG